MDLIDIVLILVIIALVVWLLDKLIIPIGIMVIGSLAVMLVIFILKGIRFLLINFGGFMNGIISKIFGLDISFAWWVHGIILLVTVLFCLFNLRYIGRYDNGF